jgi:hypothetical protein
VGTLPGGGKRTDIVVTGVVRDEASGLERELKVFLEVKGSWNPGLFGSLKTQLVDRYLDRTGCQHGVYLVGWYQCDLWDKTDPRRSRHRHMSREQLNQRLQTTALELSQGRTVKVIVLDARLPQPPGRQARRPRKQISRSVRPRA